MLFHLEASQAVVGQTKGDWTRAKIRVASDHHRLSVLLRPANEVKEKGDKRKRGQRKRGRPLAGLKSRLKATTPCSFQLQGLLFYST
jgi:hypothetical protein